MKSKNFEKKLTLNKKTIVDLSKDEMKDVDGGVDWEFTYTCSSCQLEYCCTR